MQIEVLESVSKTIGSLALAYPYLRRLGVAETIDALVTAGQERVVPTGQVTEGRDQLPVTGAQLVAAFAALSVIKQRLRVGDEVVDILTLTTLSPVQAQILARLGLMTPEVYLHPSITPHPP